MQEAIGLTGVESQQYTKKPQQDVGAFLMLTRNNNLSR